MKRNYKGDPPNPLFEKWLTEMKEQAAANDSPIQHSFGKALSSLRKCPIRLETGKDCLILQHFGKKICDILDRKLEDYKKTHNLPSSSRPSSIHKILGDEDDDDNGVGGKRAKKQAAGDKAADQAEPIIERPVFKVPRNRPYIPKVGSGAHAILTTMYNSMQEPGYPGYMLKKDIMSLAQKHCDSPMKQNAIEHYSGWSSMSTLIAKHYVIKKSNPAKYSLTDSGVALALSLIEGRAKHHRDSDDDDDENEDDNCASGSKKKPQNKNKKKPKASSSASSESDSAKPSTSGLGRFENRFSDSDDDDVFKLDYMKNLETNKAKTNEPQSKVVNSDDDLEAALAISLTETKSKKLANPPSKNGLKTDAASDDELERALALSLNETKAKKNVDLDDYNNDYFTDHKKVQENSIANQKDESDEDEDFKKALALSLNEPKLKNDVDLDVQTHNYLSDDKKLNGQDDEMDEDLKKALAMSMEEAKLRETQSDGSFDHVYDTGERPVDDFVNTERSKTDTGPKSKKVDENEIICLDDSEDDENDAESKSENKNVDESYLEFCKENAESILPVKRKKKHFIFTDGPSSSDSNKKDDDTSTQKRNNENGDVHSTPKKYDEGINHNLSIDQPETPVYEVDNDLDLDLENMPNSPKNTNPINNLKTTDFEDEILISDDEENFSKPVRTVNAVSSPAKRAKTPTKIDKPNKENSQAIAKSQRNDEFPVLPSTSKNLNVNPPKPSKATKEKANSQTNSKPKETPEEEPYDSFTLLPNNFDIILLVDTQETSGTKKKPTDDATMSALGDAGVLFEVRSLKVGDFAWIAKCRFTQKELILPYIIERKRLDDLGGSITDGRYHEQKHRLRQSGISNVIYLIEHYGKTYHGAIPLTSLFQAGINTTVQDGFITKFTKDHKDSMFYLAALTRKLIRMYKSKELVSCPKKYIQVDSDSQMSEGTERLMEFSEFNKAALKTKQFTVREMLIKQLVQLKGMSAEKAIGIAELYPSPSLLSEAFKNGGKNLLADIEVGSARRKIGPAISNVLHLFYTRANLN